jgi:hypothetical protein
VAHSFTAKTVHYRASPDMTSGEFHSIEISSINVNREELGKVGIGQVNATISWALEPLEKRRKEMMP